LLRGTYYLLHAIMDETLYKEQILDLYRNPLNKGILSDFDVQHRDFNTSCGDDVTIYIKFDEQRRVKDVSHDGAGCAISQASVSLLTDWMKGKAKQEIEQLTDEEMIAMLGIPISHARRGCALLGWKVLQAIYTENSQHVIPTAVEGS